MRSTVADVILLCGKIGCGKTTYAQKLCRTHKAVNLSVDEIMLEVFGQDAGEKHDAYTAAIKQYLLQKAVELVGCGVTVILDWGFWSKRSRDEVKAFFSERSIGCRIYYFDLPDTIWKRRIEKRNADLSAGKVQAYYVDEGLAAKCEAMFETPCRDEVDVWIECKNL